MTVPTLDGSALEIEHIAPAELEPFDDNPRSMTNAERDRLRRLLETHGMVLPIVCRAEDKLVIGGHQRLEILKQLGAQTVPVVLLHGVSDEAAVELNIALNNEQAQGSYDIAKLTGLLSELSSTGDRTPEATGFTEVDLERLLARLPTESDLEHDEEFLFVCPDCGHKFVPTKSDRLRVA